MKSESIQVFDSQGEAYKRAFQIFLDHTDQKRNAKRFLQKLVDGLPNRNVFIDAGAGNGEVTKAFAGAFCHTIAIEPNPHLLKQLKQAIPQAEAIAAPILAADPKAQGDFVLCSHTLYYIPAEEWLAHLDRLVSWMSPAGVTVVVVQNHDTACMAMLDHFFGHRFDLHQLAQAFREKHGDRYDVVITLDPAHVETTRAGFGLRHRRIYAQPATHQPATSPPGCRRLSGQTLPERRHLSPLRPPGFSADTRTWRSILNART